MPEQPQLADWVGRTQQTDDQLTFAPVRALSATLDRDDPPPKMRDELAPLGHWLYFLPSERQSGIGTDGHPKRGGFLPPVTLPRRMWAGGRLQFLKPLRLGGSVVRTSRIADVSAKSGRSGDLVFVLVRHEIASPDGIAVVEEQDIVYRDDPAPDAKPPAPQPARTDEQFSRVLHPDPVLLFRFSALTFNGHRIHYDQPYAQNVEGYPDLVVHGPLIATLLVDLVRREMPEARLATFNFRGVRPLFANAPVTLCGHRDASTGEIALWSRDAEGMLTMQASATLAP